MKLWTVLGWAQATLASEQCYSSRGCEAARAGTPSTDCSVFGVDGAERCLRALNASSGVDLAALRRRLEQLRTPSSASSASSWLRDVILVHSDELQDGIGARFKKAIELMGAALLLGFDGGVALGTGRGALRRRGLEGFRFEASPEDDEGPIFHTMAKLQNPTCDEVLPEVHIIVNNNPREALLCMASAEVLITSLSSLSWSAAVLNEGLENFMLQPHNGIFILSWYDDPNDTALFALTPLLEELAATRPKVHDLLEKYKLEIPGWAGFESYDQMGGDLSEYDPTLDDAGIAPPQMAGM
eukprot:g18824.t1